MEEEDNYRERGREHGEEGNGIESFLSFRASEPPPLLNVMPFHYPTTTKSEEREVRTKRKEVLKAPTSLECLLFLSAKNGMGSSLGKGSWEDRTSEESPPSVDVKSQDVS